MTSTNDCAVHAGTPASSSCASCGKPACERCLAWAVDGRPVCDACGPEASERNRNLGSALLVLVGVAYLAALAGLWLVFRSRPIVGGLAAISAIVVGRALQAYLGPRAVTRVERALK